MKYLWMILLLFPAYVNAQNHPRYEPSTIKDLKHHYYYIHGDSVIVVIYGDHYTVYNNYEQAPDKLTRRQKIRRWIERVVFVVTVTVAVLIKLDKDD